MLLALTLFLATAFPSNSRTAWMTPESFRLSVGMERLAAVQELRKGGWEVKQGRDANEIYIDYTGERSLTLEFRNDRLRSIRFELFAQLPELEPAFVEMRESLRKSLGEPKKKLTRSIVLYDDRTPNVMLVLSNDPKSENGKKGIGFVAVRYYDPAM